MQGDGARPHILPPLGNRLHPLHRPGVQRVGRRFLKTELDFFCPRVDTLSYYAITIFQSWDLPPTSLALIFQVILNLFTLLLWHWYEIMALYYVKSILTEISASIQDRRILQKKQNHQNQISEHMGHATDV